MGKPVDLVLEGGGVKGIALVGALSVLEEERYEAQNLAGASAGAIVAILYAAGYSAAELREIVSTLDYASFKDRSFLDKLPFGRLLSVVKDLGVYEGREFEGWIRELLEDKEVRTFGDLARKHDLDTEARYRHKAQVIASDLTDRRLLVLPRDARFLGVEPDDLDVALAVRMSMSIPVFFEPVAWRNPKTGREHLIVDGGMLSNFPVWLFDHPNPQWPTFGLKLSEAPEKPLRGSELPERVKLPSYLRSLVETMMGAHDRMFIEEKNFARTIAIDTLGVGTTEFDLSPEKAMLLYASGRDAAKRFLSTQ